jgi:hypothetical protein
VAISGSNIIVGNYYDDDLGANSGSALLYATSPTTNTPPSLSVSSPGNNSSHVYGQNVLFGATANDAQQGNISSQIVWTSNIQGQLGIGGSFTRGNLFAGTHVITIRITDNGGLSTTNIRTISVAQPGDLNRDGAVNIDDLSIIVGGWGGCPSTGPCAGDVVPSGGNGLVNVDDLILVISNWD